jgi:predicted TIM-barrel fold metal-dependent hydrolase
MIFDIHAHLFHPRWYPRPFSQSLIEDFLQRSRGSGRSPDAARAEGTVFRMLSDDTGELTLRLMDKAGIEAKVILVLDWGVELGEAGCSIETVHKETLGICARYSDRLIGFAGIDPRRPNAAQIVEHAFDTLGARGLKLHPTGQWKLTDERTHQIVELAVRRKFPVLVHVGKTLDILNDQNAQPAALIKLARLFPDGKFIAGHSGFERFEEFLNESDLPTNLYFDISAWQPLLRDERATLLARLTKLVSAVPERVCFGSDSPFFTYNLAATEKSWGTFVTDFLAGLSSETRQLASGVLRGQDIFGCRAVN